MWPQTCLHDGSAWSWLWPTNWGSCLDFGPTTSPWACLMIWTWLVSSSLLEMITGLSLRLAFTVLLACLWCGGIGPGWWGPWPVTTLSSPAPGEQPAIAAPRHPGSSYRLRRAIAYRTMGFLWDICYGIFRGEGKHEERRGTRWFGEKQVWENRRKGDKRYQSCDRVLWLIPECDDCSLSCLTTACVCVYLSPQQPPIYRVGPGLPQDSRHAGFSSLLKARMACPEHPVLMARYQAQKNYFIAVFMETWTVLDDFFYPFVSPDLIQINQSVNKWHAKESGE